MYDVMVGNLADRFFRRINVKKYLTNHRIHPGFALDEYNSEATELSGQTQRIVLSIIKFGNCFVKRTPIVF